eukprot:1150143-Pelagomonas_calceolata.AAC.3
MPALDSHEYTKSGAATWCLGRKKGYQASDKKVANRGCHKCASQHALRLCEFCKGGKNTWPVGCKQELQHIPPAPHTTTGKLFAG